MLVSLLGKTHPVVKEPEDVPFRDYAYGFFILNEYNHPLRILVHKFYNFLQGCVFICGYVLAQYYIPGGEVNHDAHFNIISLVVYSAFPHLLFNHTDHALMR